MYNVPETGFVMSYIQKSRPTFFTYDALLQSLINKNVLPSAWVGLS